jgi:hypothetical protein
VFRFTDPTVGAVRATSQIASATISQDLGDLILGIFKLNIPDALTSSKDFVEYNKESPHTVIGQSSVACRSNRQFPSFAFH